MPRQSRSDPEEICADGKDEALDHAQRRLELLRLVKQLRHDPWRLWNALERGGYSAEELSIFHSRPFDPRTRGLPEVACAANYETGELRCEHPHRAPARLDCRQWFCPHVAEMRTRLLARHGLVALTVRQYEGQ